MHSVLETSAFSRRADALLSPGERDDLILTLAADSRAGALVPGLGGIRKLRFAPEGRGKSGALRVIYYLLDDDTPILALLLYAKNEQANPTPDQRKRLLHAAEAIKVEARGRRRGPDAHRRAP